MELALGLRDLRLRDWGRQRHPQPGLCAAVEGVPRGQGGEGSRAAPPPLSRIVDGRPVAGRRGALAEAGQGGYRRSGWRVVRRGPGVRRRLVSFHVQRQVLGRRDLATAGEHPPVRTHCAGGTPRRFPLATDGAAGDTRHGYGHKTGQPLEAEQAPVYTVHEVATGQPQSHLPVARAQTHRHGAPPSQPPRQSLTAGTPLRTGWGEVLVHPRGTQHRASFHALARRRMRIYERGESLTVLSMVERGSWVQTAQRPTVRSRRSRGVSRRAGHPGRSGRGKGRGSHVQHAGAMLQQ